MDEKNFAKLKKITTVNLWRCSALAGGKRSNPAKAQHAKNWRGL